MRSDGEPIFPTLEPGSKPKRIAIFIPSLTVGGAERAMLLFGETAAGAGYEVDLVTGTADGILAEQIPKTVNVFDFKCRTVSKAVPKLIKYLYQRKPDVLYSTIVHANIAAIFASLAKPGQRVVVRECNSPITEIKALGDRASRSRRLCFRLIPWLYPLAHKVIAVSEGTRDELLQLNPSLDSCIEVLPTPVISESILRLADEPVSHPWFVDDGPPIIMGMGRLRSQKDFDILIAAVAELCREGDCRLVIFGEGPHRPHLERLIDRLGVGHQVSLPGVVSNPFPYLKRAKVFALTSRSEGMPNALIQAMAFGTNVVSTDCKSGPRELTDNGTLGWLVPVGDRPSLVQALRAALIEPDRYGTAEVIRSRYSAKTASLEYLRAGGFPVGETRSVSPVKNVHMSPGPRAATVG